MTAIDSTPAPAPLNRDLKPSREEAEAGLAAHLEDYEGAPPVELTGRYAIVGRLEYEEDQGPVLLYEVKEDGETAWLDPDGYIAAISLTEYFED